tara:strand:- start:4471 stop:5679 length:1209 start_codon:yes stop_codon:yes gene_type:complete
MALNKDIILLKGNPVDLIPELCHKLDCRAVYTNEDYEPYAKKRDLAVFNKLKEHEISFYSYKDQVIFSGQEIVKGNQTPYKVFTPYKNAWLKRITPKDYQNFKPDLSKIKKPPSDYLKQNFSVESLGFKEITSSISFGEKGANQGFNRFKKYIDSYDEMRDFPAQEKGTSHLSPHLRFGTISIRELVRYCIKNKNKGTETWLSELIWRDFYHMILNHFPHVTRHSFQPKYENVQWPGKEDHFKLWKEGNTGFPIIDAAMRHFKDTGWMHNRLRMIVASFLTKDLLIDWRKGEQYFADHLIDFDLAANNGGWQWSASTGCDAQPYFRVFNPESQSKRFDSEGTYIKTHLPELNNVPKKWIHAPHLMPIEIQNKANCIIGKNYPYPIVDHSQQRLKAIELFKKL